jgi:hypothetical protein
MLRPGLRSLVFSCGARSASELREQGYWEPAIAKSAARLFYAARNVFGPYGHFQTPLQLSKRYIRPREKANKGVTA